MDMKGLGNPKFGPAQKKAEFTYYLEGIKNIKLAFLDRILLY